MIHNLISKYSKRKMALYFLHVLRSEKGPHLKEYGMMDIFLETGKWPLHLKQKIHTSFGWKNGKHLNNAFVHLMGLLFEEVYIDLRYLFTEEQLENYGKCTFNPNPFQGGEYELRCYYNTVMMKPAWMHEEVIKLSNAIYDNYQWGVCPILADCLEEHGCLHEDMLLHLREPNHNRGCWVIDSILGKEFLQSVIQVKNSSFAFEENNPTDLDIPFVALH